MSLGSFLGSLFAGVMADRFGRRLSTAMASVIFIVGSGLMGVASNLGMLVAGRLIVGLGVGIASTTVPIYVAEVSPYRLRGTLVTINTLCVTGGQFISYLVDGLLAHTTEGWRWMLAIGAFPAFFQWIGVTLFLPESPRWLISVGRNEEGKACLRKIRRHRIDVDHEYEDIRKTIQEERGTWRDVFSKTNRFPLFLGVMLQAWQQFIGINTVMYYSSTILKDAFGGDSSNATIIWYSLPIAGLNMLGTIVALFLIDRIGRRKLLLSTIIPTTLSLVALGFAFFYQDKLPKTGYFAMGSLMCYIFSFALGFGCIPWTVNSEIYPSKIRARSNSIATSANWITNYIVAATFLSYQNVAGRGGVFWTYAGVGVLSFITIFLWLPETKGKSIEEIQEGFKK